MASKLDDGQERIGTDSADEHAGDRGGKPTEGGNFPSNTLKTALALYATGQHGLRAIGQQLGVSHEQVRIWLLDELGPEYAALQRQALIARIVEADVRLENAPGAVDIARAREIAKFARWDAERRLPQLFGPKPAVAIGVQGEGLTVNVVSYSNAAALPVNNLSTEDSDPMNPPKA